MRCKVCGEPLIRNRRMICEPVCECCSARLGSADYKDMADAPARGQARNYRLKAKWLRMGGGK